MRTSDVIRTAFGTIAKLRPVRRLSCGDCERSNRCGRPPNEDCIERAAEFERDPTGHQALMRARAARMALGHWF